MTAPPPPPPCPPPHGLGRLFAWVESPAAPLAIAVGALLVGAMLATLEALAPERGPTLDQANFPGAVLAAGLVGFLLIAAAALALSALGPRKDGRDDDHA